MTTPSPRRQMDLLREQESGPYRFQERGPFRVCLVYPNTYEVGMSNLGLQVNLSLASEVEGITCERAFMPAPHGGRGERTPPGPIVSVETGRPLDQFHVIAFSLTFELDYLNVVRILKAAGIPPLKADRGEDSPLLIAGGAAATANPAPLEPILDAVWIGESEDHVQELLAALRDGWGAPGLSRALANLPHVYVPGENRYQDVYLGTRQVDLDLHPAGSCLLTPRTVFASRALLEITRGCKWACRFCIARTLYGPVRYLKRETVLAYAKAIGPFSRRLGLFGAGISDHPDLEAILADLGGQGFDVSASSLRIGNLTPGLLAALEKAGQRTVTVAPESFSPPILRRLSKGLNPVLVERGLSQLVTSRIQRVKVYLIIGVPEETEADMALIRDTLEPFARRGRLTWDLSFSILEPKPHTPFESWALASRESVERSLRALRPTAGKVPRSRLILPSFRDTYLCDWLCRGDQDVGHRFVREIMDSPPGEFRLPYEDYLATMDRLLRAPAPSWSLHDAPPQASEAPEAGRTRLEPAQTVPAHALPHASAPAGAGKRAAHPVAVVSPREWNLALPTPKPAADPLG